MSAALFEKAARNHYRFQNPTGGGLINSEDLCELSLTKLNIVAKDLNRQIKSNEEEDFLKTERPADTELRNKFELVLYVLNTRKAEIEAGKQAADRKAEIDMLTGILAGKEADALKGLSPEEIRARIAALKA